MTDEAKPRTFHARPGFWGSEIVGPVLFLEALAIAMALWGGGQTAFLGFVGLLAMLVLLRYAVRAWLTWRQHLRLDDKAIWGIVQRRTFRIPWAHVLAAWTVDAGKQGRTLYLGTAEDVLPLSFKFFAERDLWPAVQPHLSSEATEEGAYRCLPAYHKAEERRRQYTSGMERPLRVTHPPGYRVVGWADVVLFALGAVAMDAVGEWLMAVEFLGLVGIGAWLLLNLGCTEMDAECIVRTVPLRRFRMRWDEVERIEIDPRGNDVVFYGEGKRLVIPGPALWWGPDAGDMHDLVQAQLEHRDITVRQSFWAALKGSKNTRVR